MRPAGPRPEHTPIPALLAGAGTRWQIEDDNRIEGDLAFLAVEQAHLTRHRVGDAEPDRGKADWPSRPTTRTTLGTTQTC